MIKQLLSLFFSFSGRVNRAKYICYQLALTAIIFNLLYIAGQPENASIETMLNIIIIILAISSISFTVRRLHDLDYSGPYIGLMLVPLFNIILTLVFFIKKGTDGDNKYGSDPLVSEDNEKEEDQL